MIIFQWMKLFNICLLFFENWILALYRRWTLFYILIFLFEVFLRFFIVKVFWWLWIVIIYIFFNKKGFFLVIRLNFLKICRYSAFYIRILFSYYKWASIWNFTFRNDNLRQCKIVFNKWSLRISWIIQFLYHKEFKLFLVAFLIHFIRTFNKNRLTNILFIYVNFFLFIFVHLIILE